MQLLGSGLKAYLEAVEDAFGADIGCAQLHKNYGAFNEPETRAAALRALAAILKTVSGDPDPEHVSTSYVERQTLTMLHVNAPLSSPDQAG